MTTFKADDTTTPRPDCAVGDPPVYGWQPIETAPKDEDLEVLTWNGISMRVAQYGWEDQWHTSGLPSFKPTHWMPLPDPPEPKAME